METVEERKEWLRREIDTRQKYWIDDADEERKERAAKYLIIDLQLGYRVELGEMGD